MASTLTHLQCPTILRNSPDVRAAATDRVQKTSRSRLKHQFLERDEESSDQLRRETTEESNAPTDFKGARVTPLTAAAFMGNWKLFRIIYNDYERIVGGKWTREEVTDHFRA